MIKKLNPSKNNDTVPFIILLFLFLTFANDLPAQGPSEQKNKGNNLVITAGYYRTRYNSIELTAGRGHSIAEGMLLDLSYYSAGTEFLFDKNKTYLCPKISYEYDLMFTSLKANFLYVTDLSKEGGFILRPELGLSALGYFNINYCYNINIANKTPLRQTHGIHVQWNFFPGKRNTAGFPAPTYY